MKNVFGEAIKILCKHNFVGNTIDEEACWEINYAVNVLDECQKLLPFLKSLEELGVYTKRPQEVKE